MHRAVAALLSLIVLLAVAAAPASARDGGPAGDRLTGGPRADVLHGNGGPDVLSGRGGADVLTGDTGPDRIDAGEGDDIATGASGSDVIEAGAGDDVVSGGFGADAISGGPGDDVLAGDNDDDVIGGGPGDDVIHGGSGTDVLDGGDGADVLFSDSGADKIRAGAGDDEIVVDLAGRRGIVSCGPGDDAVIVLLGDAPMLALALPKDCEHVYSTSAAVDPSRGLTKLTATAGEVVAGTPRDDTLLGGPGTDKLYGLGGNDVIWGLRQAGASSSSPDLLDGGDGDDTIYGGPGPQRISGGRGDDFIEGGLGRGTISAGSGDDVVRLRSATARTDVSLGPGDDELIAPKRATGSVRCGGGNDVVQVGPKMHLASDCERVRGGAKARAEANGYADQVRATPGLRHYWRLDEAAGSAQVRDEVGGATATVTDATLGAPGETADGHTALATSQSSRTSRVAADAPLEDLGRAFTAEMWIVPRPGNVLRITTAQGDALEVRSSGFDVTASVMRGTGSYATLTLPLKSRSWDHLGISIDDAALTLTLDDKSATASLPPGLGPWGTTMEIAPSKMAGSYLEYGAWGVDELALYDRVLDTATLAEHWRAEAGPAPTVTITWAPKLPVGTGYVSTGFRATGEELRNDCRIDGAPIGGTCTGDDVFYVARLGPHVYRVSVTDRFDRVATAEVPFVVRDVGVAAIALPGSTPESSTTIAWTGTGPDSEFECTYVPGSVIDGGATFHPCSSPATTPSSGAFAVRERVESRNGQLQPVVQFRLTNVPIAEGTSLIGQQIAIRTFGLTDPTCSIDAAAPLRCSDIVSDVARGSHSIVAQGTIPTRHDAQSGPLATRTVTMPLEIPPPPGVPLVSGVRFPALVERGTRSAPSVRFLLAEPADVTVTLRGAGGRALGTTTTRANAGAGLLTLPGALDEKLVAGRYVIDAAARSASGSQQTRSVAFAVLPKRR